MDNEYALMCDTPEIQDGWQPKEGDAVISFTSELVETSKNVFKKIRKGGTPLILHSPTSVENRWLCVYKPRIEDLLERIGNGDVISINPQTNGEWYIYCAVEHAEIHDTPTKALLKAYMHLCYGKSWDGKAWI